MALLPYSLSKRYFVPPDAFNVLEETLGRIIQRSLPEINKAVNSRDPLVSAILGRVFSAARSMERILVTKLGMNSLEIVRPFFNFCRPAGGVFHAVCERAYYRDGDMYYENYTVKVVLGVRALNSTLRRRVEDEASHQHNPVILTLSGSFHGGDSYRVVGRAVWLDAKATWYWLTMRLDGYRLFLDTLYRVSKPVRERIAEMFWESYRASRSASHRQPRRH